MEEIMNIINLPAYRNVPFWLFCLSKLEIAVWSGGGGGS